ncbi:MAG TPA: GNAT family N-acetyltransferase [Thermoanaerobaculia bacterium]|nr:GNAT family N-acetyltransferase [Thermoanaerobaculia bacterium]
MRCRELEPGEEERLLDLLDGWPFRDGRRGKDFFRRYLEDDPAYEPRNVLVAENGGELISCVQIFPRIVRTATGPRSCGGIGSVFTRPAHRRSGTASELLRFAISAMRSRGMALSLLVAGPIGLYTRLGWRELDGSEVLVEADRRELGLLGIGRPLADAGDLERVAEIAAFYSEHRLGTVVRDEISWRASLRLAGDPDEELVVAGPGRGVEAYLRLAALDGAWRALEWGCASNQHGLLAELMISHSRGALVLPTIHDEVLESELRAHGAGLRARQGDGTWMLRGVTMSQSEATAALPVERFAFWPADRF